MGTGAKGISQGVLSCGRSGDWRCVIRYGHAFLKRQKLPLREVLLERSQRGEHHLGVFRVGPMHLLAVVTQRFLRKTLGVGVIPDLLIAAWAVLHNAFGTPSAA